MKERWKGSDANRHGFWCTSQLSADVLSVGGFFLLLFFPAFVYFLRTHLWRWERALSKMWSYLFKFLEHTGKRFSPNEDSGLCVVFIYIWCFGSFLLWITESWLNMSTTQLNITLQGKFILCTPLPFYCDEKRGEKNPETQRAVTLIGHSSQCLPSQNSDNAAKTIQWSKAVMRFFSSINRHDLAKWRKMV